MYAIVYASVFIQKLMEETGGRPSRPSDRIARELASDPAPEVAAGSRNTLARRALRLLRPSAAAASSPCTCSP